MRLIDADKLRKDIIDMPNCYNGYSDTYDKAMIVDMIDEQSSVDAVPVKRGKWITCTSSEHWKCSECGCRAGYWFNEENSGIDSWEMDFSEWLSDYCPNCGARMDEE